MKGTAIVTGGAKRIGRSICLDLARKGYDIVFQYNSSVQAAKEVTRCVEKLGRKCYPIACDFNNMKQVSILMPRIYEMFPTCDLLINNASIFERSSLRETDSDQFDRHMNINLKTPFILTRDFAYYCKKGHVINILDTKVERTVVNYFAYTLTKKALLEFTKMAAKELAPNIRVNGVCPGLILPPPDKDETYLTELSKNIPLRQTGNVENITSAINFLIDNHFITGEYILIDGGEHLK